MAHQILVHATTSGDTTTVEALIKHPMDSGFVRDKAGKIIPPHYIEVIEFTCQGRTVLTGYWGPAVSKNPFIKFSFKGGKAGQPIGIAWVDNKGETATSTANIV
ncbi:MULTISPECIES: thiosulfate oxidation carrier complex protein SoxZ [Acidiphilium]|jgi:sulfur-oxidizing protein SoxZ|uniref:Sulfur compound chelating protein SoxZ n=1 Tax=Acidiphilium rubrum TaxID=526 RepID=A0A8G2FHK6_ACIRU|nr:MULTISPECIES: thiosulfate oxidation carrier complex protein SoxZ [Acidiphilium]MBW4034243.1 thiosulfate oxidation carrier complex protein SoxZ [Pseudomonadota bacterium]OYW01624.1 MAG: thiosulfate oxidation carrier complex protein SoxZ [Acidiphilium sp. 37-64-53]OZB29433.1 MAG: thiosulfate oxidation carrier complex protein SoxZ [Acidiphilium sp. 34-64-41]SIR26093.1 sulfur compound chelating protein SoxZ [Acidiphilium rubrum]HQT83746.1 thiosulfate oxidation carrier complex protein SoxZ [Acid